MEFKVKRSFLSIFIFNLVLIFLICVSVPFAYNTWVFAVVFAIVFSLFCFYNSSIIFAICRIENNKIIYRTGAFKYEININTIQKIQKNKSYSPSLATSFDRIRIVTNKNNIQKVYYISVVDRDKFIDIINNKIDANKKVKLKVNENKNEVKKTANTTSTSITKKQTSDKKNLNTTKKTTSAKKSSTASKKTASTKKKLTVRKTASTKKKSINNTRKTKN